MKNNPKQKIIIISSLFIILFIIVCIVYYILQKKDNTSKYSDKSTQEVYYDPGSGETLVSPPGKAKEKNDNTIIFLGFTKLLDHGISYKQLNKLESHFKQYGVKNNIKINEVSMTVSTYKSSFDKNTGEIIMSFEVTINRKDKLNAQVKYINLNMPFLYLYNQKTSARIFLSE